MHIIEIAHFREGRNVNGEMRNVQCCLVVYRYPSPSPSKCAKNLRTTLLKIGWTRTRVYALIELKNWEFLDYHTNCKSHQLVTCSFDKSDWETFSRFCYNPELNNISY